MKNIEELTKANQELLKELGYTGLFAERDNLQSAADYKSNILDTLSTGDKIAVVTMMQVYHNTFIHALVEKYEITDRSTIPEPFNYAYKKDNEEQLAHIIDDQLLSEIDIL